MALGAGLGWWWARRRFDVVFRCQQQALETALAEARIDPLTAIGNRKAFEESLSIQVAISRRYQTPCALVLIDVDDLKAINDRGGHAAGDEALRRMAGLLRSTLRESDLLMRLGGDEFALILPHTELVGAQAAASRLVSQLSGPGERSLDGGGGSRVLKASLGVAELRPDESADDLVSRADQAQYAAKRAGGNRICVHDGVGPVDAAVTVPATGRSDSSFPPDGDRADRPA